MKHLVKVLEKCFGLCPIAFLNVFSIYLNYGWESVDDELFKKGAAGDGVAGGFDVDDFEVGDVLEFGDLEQ